MLRGKFSRFVLGIALIAVAMSFSVVIILDNKQTNRIAYRVQTTAVDVFNNVMNEF